MKGNGPLDFEATIDAKTFNSMLDEMERRIKGVSSTAERETSKIDDSFRKVALAVGGYFSFAFGAQFTKEIVNVRGEFQQLEIAFETMLKNKAKSDALLADVTMFAAKTPFDMKQVATGAKQLLAYGEASEEVVVTMKKLGDIAAGLSIPFGDLVYLYGTTRTQGRMMTKDLMQFAGRGIPIIEELSKVLKVSKADILDLASKGELSFEHLQVVIDSLTASTGMFGGMMDKQAASLPGLISNLGDAWDRMLNKIGTGQQDTFADAIKLATEVVENYEVVVDILKVVIASYGAYRAAVLLNAIAVNGYSKALGLAIIKEKALALARKANPWGLALAGITAVIGALVVYKNRISEVDEAQQQINERIRDEVGAMDQLFETLKRGNVSADQRKAIIDQINEKYGQYLPNLLNEKSSMADIAAAYTSVNTAMRHNIELTVKRSKAQELYLKLYEQEMEYDRVSKMTGDEYLKEFKGVEGIKGQARRTRLKAIKEVMDELRAEYETFMAELQTLDGDMFAPPSFDYSKLFPDDKEGDKKIKTFSQKLDEIRKLYENYYLWAENYGKDSADKQFSGLLKGGQNYLTYLNNEIKKLEGLQKKTPGQNDNLLLLLSERTELTGGKSRVDKLREEIDAAKDSYSSLVDYIGFLGKKLDQEQAGNDGGERTLAVIQLLQEELSKAQKEYVSQSLATYNSLIEQSADYAKRRLLIEEEYQKTVAKLDKESLGNDKYEEAIKEAEIKRKQALNVVQEDEARQSEAYRKIRDAIEELTNKEVKKYIAQLKQQLLLLDSQSDAYKEISGLIKTAEKGLSSKTAEGFDAASQALGDMAQMAGAFNKELSESIQFASQMAGAVGQIASGNVIGGIAQGVASIFTYVANTAARKEQQYEEDKQRQLEATGKLIEKLNKGVEKQIDLINELVGNDKLNQYGRTVLEISRSMSEVINQMEDLDQLVKKAMNGRTYAFSLSDKFSEANFDLSGITGVFERIEALREAIRSIEDDIDAVNAQIDNGTIKGEDVEQLQQFLATYQDYVDKLKEVQNQYFAELTGTSYDSIVDGVLSAFEQGLRGAEDFADTFEGLMRKAMLQALSVNALQAPLQGWYEMFAQMTEEGLSEQEIAVLRESYNSIIQNADEYAKMLENAAGINLSGEGSKDALSGAIKGVSEETAGLIAGQMNAIRMNQAQMLVLLNDRLGVLNQIENHSRNMVYMKRIYDFLTENNSGSSVLTNRFEG